MTVHQIAPYRDEALQPFTRALPGAELGPHPWCRQCRKSVSWWEWERLHAGWWGFDVLCHGERMSGVVREPSPGGVCRLEVFAWDDPHMEAGPFWWVTQSGGTLQESRRYLATMEGRAFFGGPVGLWIRRHGEHAAMIMTAVLTALAWLR